MVSVYVYVMFNGASERYEFKDNLDGFMKKWKNQVHAVGYFTGEDARGRIVMINPSQCATIEIREIRK